MIFVVIPVYNNARYLTECLDSVFSQTYSDIFVVCTDDGSTDDSPTVLSMYEKKHPNMIVFRTENHGPSHARNVGLDYVSRNAKLYDYLFFLDSDDYLGADYLRRLLSAVEETPCDIVCSSFTYTNSSGEHRFLGMEKLFGICSPYEATKLLLEDQTVQSHAHCKLYRASLFKQLRYPNEFRFMEDQATIFKAFAESKSVTMIKEYGYFYRQRDDSLCSGEISNSKAMDAIEAYMEPLQYDFRRFSDDEKRVLYNATKQSLAACYLMMYPRYKKKTAFEREKERWASLRNYLKTEKIVSSYRPDVCKEKMKRRCYLYLRPFYRALYSMLSR